MDRMQLLCDINELNHLFRDSVSIETFLQRTVVMVTEHMTTDVCSIYLYDEDTEILTLKATQGLHADAIDHVSMRIGDGLTGQALKELRPVCVVKASKEPEYKLFIGSGEEEFDHFLAVPITRGVSRVGVLVLQRKKKRFKEEDVMACKAVASQLVNIIENAKFLMTMHTPYEQKKLDVIPADMHFVKGKTASEGFAYSHGHVLDKEKTFSALQQKDFGNDFSIEDFREAVGKTAEQLQQLQKQVEEKLSDAASLIFASHLLILKDKEFVGQMESLIETGTSAPLAVLKVAKHYIDLFAVSEHVYMREKVQDVEDLGVRLVANLTGEYEQEGYSGKRIVIARDIFPSDLLKLSSEEIQGVVLVSGGVTSHLSILARSLQIPMVIANNPKLLSIPDGTMVIVDADAGNVYVDPTEEILSGFENRRKTLQEESQQIIEVADETLTKDGTKIKLVANINLLSDLVVARKMKCEGVGLYRTEFPFIIRNDFPSEQEQYFTYRKVFEAMEDKPVVFRTLDIGGDKVLSYYNDAKEQNPGMGMRSIRFSLQNKGIFAKQIRAILRAGAEADLRIMFPMIASIEELFEAKAVVQECKESLRHADTDHNANPQIGMMIELPSVVELIDAFAKEVDFFSIGTNDFVQFMLGVDRTNENVESFYQPHHPAVLRAISKIVQGAAKYDKAVSICGEMAHDIAMLKFLVGAGVRLLSFEANYLPRVQQAINEIELSEAQELARQVLTLDSATEIAKLLGIKTGNTE